MLELKPGFDARGSPFASYAVVRELEGPASPRHPRAAQTRKGRPAIVSDWGPMHSCSAPCTGTEARLRCVALLSGTPRSLALALVVLQAAEAVAALAPRLPERMHSAVESLERVARLQRARRLSQRRSRTSW